MSDILCGYNAGVKSLIHVLTGHGRKDRASFHNLQACQAHLVAENILHFGIFLNFKLEV